MKILNNLKIGKRLIACFVLVALISAIVGLVGLTQINKINKQGIQSYETDTLGIVYVANASVSYQRIRYNLLRLLLINNNDEEQIAIKGLEDNVVILDKALSDYEERIEGNKEDQAQFDGVVLVWNEYKNNVDSIIQNFNKNKEIEDGVLDKMTALGEKLQGQFLNIYQYNSERAAQTASANNKISRNSRIMMIVMIIIGFVVAAFLGVITSRGISRPIEDIVEAANHIAVGDVDIHINLNTKDEIGGLAEAFRNMVSNIREQALIVEKISGGDLTSEVHIRSEKDLLGKKLYELVEKNNEVLSNILIASDQVAEGARQISDTSMTLSQGATEQASAIEELTASIEEISAQTKQNADNATQANHLAESTKKNAHDGNQQMQEMLQAMIDINHSSSNISKIIKVIDDIAFQTNILALNAAVEAARAGQHGKGFAVVAEEVRNLAARSAAAAKETTEMIESSIKKVENGTSIANLTAEALNKIMEDVDGVVRFVNEIAVASNEQALGIAQVNQGVMQVSQVVQNNSATSEESASASEELSSQAELLKSQIGRYKLKGEKKSSRVSNIEGLNPEVLQMLDKMSKNKKQSVNSVTNKVPMSNPSNQPKVTKQIILSDNEFGKY